MSFQYSWSVVRSHINSKTFTRNSLAAAVGLVLSSQALAGFPTLYGKIHLTANQYDLEKINFPASVQVLPTQAQPVLRLNWIQLH